MKSIRKNQGIICCLLAVILFILLISLLAILVYKPEEKPKKAIEEKILPQPKPEEEEPEKPVEEYWNQINLSKVEPACLNASKNAAGELAWAVAGCKCREQTAENEKKFECSVTALDGLHSLSINCFKELKSCEINSEKGNFLLSFPELEELISTSK